MDKRHVLLIAPAPPPYGGMALQAQLLARMLRSDGNPVFLLPSNFPFPEWLRWMERIPAVRTALRAVLVWPALWKHTRNVDVVHVLAASWLYFFLTVFPAVTVARIRRKRVVLNYRGGEAREFFRRWGWLAALVLKSADVVTAPSEFLAGVIQSRFGVAVDIVPNILDLGAFRYRQRMTFGPALVVTRHLEKIYDIDAVLRAFHLVQQRHPEATLLIAGTGSEEQSLRRLAAELHLNNIRFVGDVPHANLPALYEQCDILVNASRVDNFPGALLEASAAGLAVVSTKAGGIPFIYEHESTAILVDPGDWDGLAEGINRIVSCPSLGVRLTTAAARIARRCDWQEVRGPLYKTYEAGSREEGMCIAG